MRKLFQALYLIERRTWFIAVFECALVFMAFVFSWWLIHDLQTPTRHELLTIALPLICVRLITMARFGLLHGWWRYVGFDDAIAITKSVVAGSLLLSPPLLMLLGRSEFPARVIVLEAVLTGSLLAGVRAFSRILAESVREHSAMPTRIGLIGAGYTAQLIIRESSRPYSKFEVAACFDDNASKKGMRLNGVPVVGAIDELPRLVDEWNIDELLIAVPSATSAQMRRFFAVCEKTHLRFRTVPALQEFISGQDAMRQVREVALEDLLGREPVRIDLKAVREHVKGKVIMVTGAAGSIGSELARQLVNYDPAMLLCVDQNETGMFYLEREISERLVHNNGVFIVANIGDSDRMHKVCSTYGVDVIFHAAAYKHVPMMETNVQEAVNNNVFAFMRLLRVAEDTGCRTFIMISSDKAVNPTNIMGCTKRIGELILSAWPADGMRCVSVRFGNVLGSNGSVVPVFQDLIKRNQPLSVTHPEIQRFFMTIREAVALVLQASAIGNHGDILVLDMGEPVRIVDLAKTLILLSGKRCDEIPIRITGLRQGEKLTEELFYQFERIHPTECMKIKRTSGSVAQWAELESKLAELRTSMYVDGADPVRRKLQEIVPEARLNSNSAASAADKTLAQTAS